MKKEEAGGIGWMVVAGVVDIRRGSADTAPFSSSATKPSSSCSSVNRNVFDKIWKHAKNKWIDWKIFVFIEMSRATFYVSSFLWTTPFSRRQTFRGHNYQLRVQTQICKKIIYDVHQGKWLTIHYRTFLASVRFIKTHLPCSSAFNLLVCMRENEKCAAFGNRLIVLFHANFR